MIKIPTFLKWAGGKRRIINDLNKYFPTNIERYFEPFLGAGSVFFYVKQKYNPRYCQISDINQDLINVYLAIRDNPIELIKAVEKFRDKNNKEDYYQIRKRYNNDYYKNINKCAAFIFLNKTCYGGIFRVNSKNEFNVPFGSYKKLKLIDRDDLHLAHKLLQGVEIVCQDYRNILSFVRSGDFVYLDPCYDPLKKTSFTSYTPNKFSEKDRLSLLEFNLKLKNKKVNFVLSNNDLKIIRKMYSDQGFNIRSVEIARNLNPINKTKINDLIINNF